MLYDLNIAWSPGTPAADLERTLKFAKNLGYDVVALNHIISGPIPTQPTPITNPIPQLTPPHPSYPGGGTAATTTATKTKPTISTTTAPPPTTTPLLPTTLRRATLSITDPSTTNYRLGDFGRAYDLVALRPTTERAFAWACTTASSAGDAAGAPALVSLDLSAPLGWHLHHRTAMAAVQRGVRFEVCYAQALRAGSGAGVEAGRARVNFIGNVQALVRATKGRGVVVSSEARGVLGLRGPADVVNLMAVWGLGPEKGFAALGEGARAVVVNEGVKRRGFRGVVDIVRPAEGGEEMRKGGGSGNGNGEGEGGNGNKVGKKQKQQGQQGQKRKNEGGGGGGGGGQTGEVSKRQAKKMRKEASQSKA
ncbi:RNase P subunit p30-domain-containing protein [Chaetomium fimeti]|uniref:RNase P subunit p30-domain-containing protein n=1 Tax=Chaetomium fimeti TaxID=1854472 RepID=A0AAE0LWM9_9PEZI|nr:RNase P subunit p30-domain-containing protein [Chaetomium fimeti]